MSSYICLTYATANRAEAKQLSDLLTKYGYRHRAVNEETDNATRLKHLSGAAIILALTSPEAEQARTVMADLRRPTDRGWTPLCISLGENGIDRRFCTGTDGTAGGRRSGAVLIPYPVGDTLDAHSMGLFVHRLFVCQLCRLDGIFWPPRCTMDAYGTVIVNAIRAHRGSKDAAYALGCAYERGEGVPVLEYEASRWISRAAEAGLVNARLHMGELCLTGWGTEPDPAEAYRLFSMVAAKGDVRGEYRLGLCYLNGVGVVKDPGRAMYHLKRAAEWEYAPALYRLGLLYRDGIGTAPDTHAAMTYFYRTCRHGSPAPAEPETPPADPSADLTLAADLGVSELLSMGPKTASDESARETDRCSVAAPSSLYGRRAGERLIAVTVRHLRRGVLRTAVERRVNRGGHRVPEARLEALAARSFCRLSVKDVARPEDTWIGGMTKPVAGELAAATRSTAHLEVYVDRDDLAMGVPFDVSDAAVALGRILEVGNEAEGLYPHPTRALVWYRYALRLGHSEALYRLADAYRRGAGSPPDPAWAVTLYRMAAEWGDARGQFALAVCCERGIGIEPDMAEAIRRYEQSAVAGYAPAQNNLGGCYEYGIGVQQNILTAVDWYARAAGADQPDALCRLAMCYERGNGVPVDYEQAYRLYDTAARHGHGYALYRLGVCCSRGYCYDRTDADAPSPAPSAKPVPRYAKAVELWRQAADLGVADAAYALAIAYAYGHGVRRDEDRAMAYLYDATELGHVQAAYRLGLCCMEGKGVVKSPLRAVAYFDRAIALWREKRAMLSVSGLLLPVDARSPMESAGGALYMRGYCALYDIGQTEPSCGDDNLPEERRVHAATAYFREAADLYHVGALTALGDLIEYAYMPAPSGNAYADSAHYYEEAVRVAAARQGKPSPLDDAEMPSPEKIYEGMENLRLSGRDTRTGSPLTTDADLTDKNSINALMTLARRYKAEADSLRREHDIDGATPLWQRSWRLLSAAVEQGSVDALLIMAEYLQYGRGVPQLRPAAMKLLERAERVPGGRMAASMWVGDYFRAGWHDNHSNAEEADHAYLRALQTRFVCSESGPYVLGRRRKAKLEEERQIRAEVYYRLASFRADRFPDDHERSLSTFHYLTKAILLHHEAARDDLARVYDYYSHYNDATATRNADADPTAKENEKGSRVVKRLERQVREDSSWMEAARTHRYWLKNYYAVLLLEPCFFQYHLRSQAADKPPEYVTKPVTPAMRVASLNYLADCLFYGKGIPEDPVAAVACYREVVETRLELRRGDPIPPAVTWSQYSLGWCLLHGVGTKKNAREAVKWLSMAARSHAEANHVLGQCYETGEGVDVADDREAIKYYRKALKLGCTYDEGKVSELEKRLKGEN